ncbi:MAG: GAF domain-containing protein [Chloroflexi bacterium]|nr:GAF domain-containing protein [Chloroflexota bacterium]
MNAITQPTDLDEHKQRPVKAPAPQEVIALREVKLIEAMQDIVENLLGLRREDPLALILDRAGDLLHTTDGAIWTLAPGDDQTLLLQQATGGYRHGQQLPVSGSLAGHVLQRKVPAAIQDLQSDPRFRHKEMARKQGWVSALFAPMLGWDNRPAGVCTLFTNAPRVFSDRDQRLLMLLARHAAMAMHERQSATETFAATGDEAGGAVPARVPGDAAPQTGPVSCVLVVEEDASWRKIFCEILQRADFRVETAVSYGEALGWLRRAYCDVAIVDLRLASSVDAGGRCDGLRLLEAARKRGIPTVTVGALATPAEIEHAYEKLGTYAFLEKDKFDRYKFLQSVRGADRHREAVEQRTGEGLLSPRQKQVLVLVAEGLTNQQIADRLVISVNTVKKHVHEVLKKTGTTNRVAAIRQSTRLGLLDGVDERQSRGSAP